MRQIIGFIILALLIRGNAMSQKTFSVGGVQFNMVFVEGGTFTMGCIDSEDSVCNEDELPRHSVTLSSYYIGETEVTQALWKAVMYDNPSMFKGDSLPVENVTYDEILFFITVINQTTGSTFRLPTEAEWEYAARGGANSMGYHFSGSNNIDEVAWYKGNSKVTTHAVKTKKANELGIYDMSGNVREWCSDWKGSYGSAPLTDPTGPEYGGRRIYRGGSWFGEVDLCRVTCRTVTGNSPRSSGLGLRLVMIP